MDVRFMEGSQEHDFWPEAEDMPEINHTMVINGRDYLVIDVKWLNRYEVNVEVEDIAKMRQREQERIDDDELRSRGLL